MQSFIYSMVFVVIIGVVVILPQNGHGIAVAVRKPRGVKDILEIFANIAQIKKPFGSSMTGSFGNTLQGLQDLFSNSDVVEPKEPEQREKLKIVEQAVKILGETDSKQQITKVGDLVSNLAQNISLPRRNDNTNTLSTNCSCSCPGVQNGTNLAASNPELNEKVKETLAQGLKKDMLEIMKTQLFPGISDDVLDSLVETAKRNLILKCTNCTEYCNTTYFN